MYAIVEIAGQQFKVAKDQKVFVHRLPGEEGDKVTFDKVLLTEDGDDVSLGAPAISGANVSATINRHLRGDKVIVFKKKRRKGYRKKNGHRQHLTELTIGDIDLGSPKKQSSDKASAKADDKQPQQKAKADEPKETKQDTTKADEGKDLSGLTVAELTKIAKERNLKGHSGLKKAELINLIEENENK